MVSIAADVKLFGLLSKNVFNTFAEKELSLKLSGQDNRSSKARQITNHLSGV